MNDIEKNEDFLLGDLLKKSMVNVPSSDFTDKLMERIEAQQAPLKSGFLISRLSWVFFSMAILLLPFSLKLIMSLFHQKHFVQYFDKISPVIMILFSLMVLFQLDNLLKSFFGKKAGRENLGKQIF